MCKLKHIETQRTTAKRLIKLTNEQWISFIESGLFIAKVYSSYSLRVNDLLYLTCDMDPLSFQFSPLKAVTVINIDESHSSNRNGGYNEVSFSILSK